MAEAPEAAAPKKVSTGFGMLATIKMIHAKFSKVKDMPTETLASMLQSETSQEGRKVVLLDCRDPSEHEVSLIEGAQLVDWKHVDPAEVLESLPKDKPSTVVCYCSVGYRSSALADRLQNYLAASAEAEPKPDVQVYNLEGSIFKWANEGRPLVDPMGKTASQCHPYSAVWGKLLNKELRSNSPYVA